MKADFDSGPKVWLIIFTKIYISKVQVGILDIANLVI